MPAKVLSKLSEEEKTDLITDVKRHYEEAKGHFTTYHKDRFDRFYKNFRDYGDDRLDKLKEIGGDKWMSNLFVPITASHIRTAQSKINVRLPEWKVWAAKEEHQGKVSDVNDMLEYSFEKVKLDKKVKDIVKTAMLYGTAFGKKIWLKDKYYRKVWEKNNKNDGNDVLELVNKESYRMNDPAVINCDVYGLWPDPKGTVINFNGQDAACGYVIQRYVLTKEQVAQQYNVSLKVLNDLKVKGWDTQDYGRVRLDVYKKNANSKLNNGSNPITTSTSADISQLVEVVEHWTDSEWTVCVGDVIIIHMPNPYGFEKPFERLCYEELPGQMYGVGLAEQVEQVQAGVNTITNITIDNTTLNVHSMFTAPEGKNYNAKDFVVRPYGVVRGDVKPMARTPMDPAAYRERDMQISYGNMASGISDAASGETLQASTVATSVNAQQGATEDRLGMFIDNLNEFYGGVMKSFVEYMYWFYPVRTVELAVKDGKDDIHESVEVFDFEIPIEQQDGSREYKPVEREQLNAEFYYRNANRSAIKANKELKRKQVLELSDRIQNMANNQFLAPAMRKLDPTKLVQDILEAYDYDPERMQISEEDKAAQDAEREAQAKKEAELQNAPQGSQSPVAAGFNQFGPIPQQAGQGVAVDDRGQGQAIGGQLSNMFQ